MKKKNLGEVVRFVITGGACFFVEFVLLVILRDTVHLPTLVANAFAFLVSVIVNYVLCLLWVFRGAKGGRGAQAGFLITSLIGLLLNELFMLLFGTLWGEDQLILTVIGKQVSMYMLNKCLATLLVMIWNFFSKRYVLQRRAKKD